MEGIFQKIDNSLTVSKVWFKNRSIFVEMNTGEVISKSIELYPHLRKGTLQQWEHFELWDGGKWIHWEELDEDLSAEGFLT